MACANAKPKFSAVLKSASNDSLYTLVVAQHDSVMPKTSLMNALQRQLKALLTTTDVPKKDSVLAALLGLKKGEDAMMQWMNEFKNIDIDTEHYTAIGELQIKDYLLNEQKKILNVTDLMLNSIKQAEQTLKQ